MGNLSHRIVARLCPDACLPSALQHVAWPCKELLLNGPFVVGIEVYDTFFFTDFASRAVYTCSEVFLAVHVEMSSPKHFSTRL